MVISNLASAIGKVATGDVIGARELVDGVARALGARRQEHLPGIAAPDAQTSLEVVKARVDALFAYWRDRTGHKQAKPTPDRIRAIAARLREGYTDADIRKAFDGAAENAFVNDDGHKYDDVTLICRSGSKLELFIARGIKATGDVVVDAESRTPIDEKIAGLRREMADLKKAGRDTEYEQRRVVLVDLLAKRKGNGKS